MPISIISQTISRMIAPISIMRLRQSGLQKGDALAGGLRLPAQLRLVHGLGDDSHFVSHQKSGVETHACAQHLTSELPSSIPPTPPLLLGPPLPLC